MAFKQFHLDEVGPITVYKRRGSRNIRLAVAHDGTVKVTIPAWAPYASGVDFARTRGDWIAEHSMTGRRGILCQGQQIGKAHRLHFIASQSLATPTARLKGTLIVIRYPIAADTSDDEVQTVARNASIKALRAQAQKLLAIRLQELADKHGYDFKSMAVKRLKGRWGSCDQDKHIIFNLFLIQLPWELIDYVIMHELAHTRVLHHGPQFWAEMEQYTPRAKDLRRQIHSHQPILIS